jgi:flagellar biosynthesis protein FlhG
MTSSKSTAKKTSATPGKRTCETPGKRACETPGKRACETPVYCISSGKGGVGKTTCTVNIGTALAQKGIKTLIIDGDLGLGNVDVTLGLQVSHTIRETVELNLDIETVLLPVIDNLTVLPASSGVPEMASISKEEQLFLISILDTIIHRFDIVLVDSAAGIGDSVLWFSEWATENIIIVTPDPTSLTDGYALMKILSSKYGKKKFQLIVNNVKSQKEGRETSKSIGAVLKRFLHITPALLGILPKDTQVVQAIRKQTPFLINTPDCRAAKGIRQIADKIMP